MSKPHTLNLTNGSLGLLGKLAAQPGLLTDAVTLRAVGQFAEDHASDVQPPEAITVKELTAWERTARPAIEVSEKTRDALKRLVTVAIEKGMVGGHPAVLGVMRELGLGE